MYIRRINFWTRAVMPLMLAATSVAAYGSEKTGTEIHQTDYENALELNCPKCTTSKKSDAKKLPLGVWGNPLVDENSLQPPKESDKEGGGHE